MTIKFAFERRVSGRVLDIQRVIQRSRIDFYALQGVRKKGQSKTQATPAENICRKEPIQVVQL